MCVVRAGTMDGVQYQIEQLQCELGKLNPHRLLLQEDAVHLQLALANATAIAHRIVEEQNCRTFPMRFTAVGTTAKAENDDGSGANSNGHLALAPDASAVRTTASTTATAASAGGGGGGGEGEENGTSETRPRRSGGSAVKQWQRETIRSIANGRGISIGEIRSVNPQLSVFNDDDVLPPNTYIKMKFQVNQSAFLNGTYSGIDFECAAADAVHIEEDTMVVEVPLPLAPLPSVQKPHLQGRSTCHEKRLASHEKDTQRGEETSGHTGSPNRAQLVLPLPSPLRSRRDMSHESSIISNGSGTLDCLDRRHTTQVDATHAAAAAAPGAASVGVPLSTSRLRNTTDTNVIASAAVSATLLSDSKACKPPTTKSAASIVPLNALSADANAATVASAAHRLWGIDHDQSLVTESSSYHSNPTPLLPVALQSSRLTHSDLENTQRSLEHVAESRKNVAEMRNKGQSYSNVSGLSPPRADNSTLLLDESEEYDTLNSIALQYEVTVEDVVKWNPYLTLYREDEPLPANLPIVLPR